MKKKDFMFDEDDWDEDEIEDRLLDECEVSKLEEKEEDEEIIEKPKTEEEILDEIYIEEEIDRKWLKTQNIVSTSKTNIPLNLRDISLKDPTMTFSKPDCFSALVFRMIVPWLSQDGTIKKYKMSQNFFDSGKQVSAGPKSEGWVLFSIYKSIEALKEYNPDIWSYFFKIRNIVSTLLLPFEIDLDKIYSAFRGICSYSPEDFPGLTMKSPLSSSSNMFGSGVAGIAGAKTLEIAYKIACLVYNRVKPFQIKKRENRKNKTNNKEQKQKTTVNKTKKKQSNSQNTKVNKKKSSLVDDQKNIKKIRLEKIK